MRRRVWAMCGVSIFSLTMLLGQNHAEAGRCYRSSACCAPSQACSTNSCAPRAAYAPRSVGAPLADFEVVNTTDLGVLFIDHTGLGTIWRWDKKTNNWVNVGRPPVQ